MRAMTEINIFKHASDALTLDSGEVLFSEGDTEWITSPSIDSYHTVWMQLHEDLLLALGRDRATEEVSDQP